MRELSVFLLARIAEDEVTLAYLEERFGLGSRWRADCASRRRIVQMIAIEPTADGLEGADVLRVMAAPYAQHPDYQQHWHL